MARRPVLHRDVCSHDGCSDTTFTSFDTQRDYREFLTRRAKVGKPYLCIRHSDPDRNLRPDHLATQQVLVASRSRHASGLYWVPEGSDLSGSGFTHGPGFTAYATDFPEGTRLTVTTSIEMPNP